MTCLRFCDIYDICDMLWHFVTCYDMLWHLALACSSSVRFKLLNSLLEESLRRLAIQPQPILNHSIGKKTEPSGTLVRIPKLLKFIANKFGQQLAKRNELVDDPDDKISWSVFSWARTLDPSRGISFASRGTTWGGGFWSPTWMNDKPISPNKGDVNLNSKWVSNEIGPWKFNLGKLANVWQIITSHVL